jgi:hypothetical protein
MKLHTLLRELFKCKSAKVIEYDVDDNDGDNGDVRGTDVYWEELVMYS